MSEFRSRSTVADHYFCSATIRPSGCLKKNSICCLHCDKSVQCETINHKGTKPCNFKTMSFEEECPYSI